LDDAKCINPEKPKTKAFSELYSVFDGPWEPLGKRNMSVRERVTGGVLVRGLELWRARCNHVRFSPHVAESDVKQISEFVDRNYFSFPYVNKPKQP
jgi:hypothetical protein